MSTGKVLLTGSLTGTGGTTSSAVYGLFNVSLSGTFVATVQVERSFDSGSTWIVVAADGTGDPASYTIPISLTGIEIEEGVLYRFNCTAYTSGTVNFRLSASNWSHRL